MAKKKTDPVVVKESPIEHLGLMVWDAFNGVGKPVCVGSRKSDDSLSVNIYHLDGKITGVTVYDQLDLIGASGFVPDEIVLDEVKYAGL